jgi:hypothetical protein
MSSLTNINNNSSVVNVGRTTPVNPGPQLASASIPVVLASDQTPIPVVEQNKIQSEVALSLLGIPRAEVALGIFADVNTYDVNPSEWSSQPPEHMAGFGIKHLAEEAGALVESPKNEVSILTSKRFFRYQPGRVSAATFGIKSSLTPTENVANGEYNLNPAIRKYGIFDNYDGYYWETRADGIDDRFSVVRRTQSLLKYNPVLFGSGSTQQQQDHRFAGKAASTVVEDTNLEATATKLLVDNRFTIATDAFNVASAQVGTTGTYLNGLSDADRKKCLRDMDLAIDAYINDLQYGGNGHIIVNATTYATALLNNSGAEQAVHQALGDGIKTFLGANNETAAQARMDNLAIFMTNAVGGVQPTQLQIDAANYGQRSKLSTVFSIYEYYLGYLISESQSYTNTNPNLSVDEIKYRCQRDVAYIVDGYSRDLEFGGNSATVYNAKNYYFNGIQVYSQTAGGVISEIARHQYLKQLIGSSSTVAVVRSNSTTVNISSTLTKFGLTANKVKLDSLADLIISNFTSEYAGPAEFGSGAQFGDLIIYRDNLLMVHAAVYDPALLIPKKQVVVKIDITDNSLESSQGSFVNGQHINFIGNAGGMVSGKTYIILNVAGRRSNIIKLGDPAAVAPTAIVDITTIGSGTQYIEPNIPFVFPNEYFVGNNPLTPLANYIRPDGMFPYLYSQDGILPATVQSLTVGFVDTAIDTSSSAATLKQQIDLINLRYNNWIKRNVDPTYYSVYEYRVPRSRFSTDQLNGEVNRTVYSDIATSVTGKAYAGQPVINTTGVQLQTVSAWDLDFTKVVMLKIEFSWYGAVGALFLAYVPVSNGEARWVRVHHLRASNQLKIPSLGNATLPITYLVYGGGTVNKLGVADTTDKGYGTASEHIVKYGASYYIDGGDRGTVRLYSYSNDVAVDAYGSKFVLGTVSLITDAIGTYIDVSAVVGLPANKVFFVYAKLITSSRQDQNIEIVWVDDNKIYISRSALISTNGVYLVASRSSIVFGLKAKQAIDNQAGVGVRNRVQVYPTKLSTANLTANPLKLKITKTPIFQPVNTTTGSFSVNTSYDVTSANLLLPTSFPTYITKNNDFVYGWFRANVGTVFGKLYKDNGNYYFTLLETYGVIVTLLPNVNFLKEQRFDFQGNVLTAVSESAITKERLSSVFVSTEIQCAVPKTGIEIASFFLNSGSDQFDLLSYFDYNKDYLSFPLTNDVDSLYLFCDNANNIGLLGGVNASLTWEEQ